MQIPEDVRDALREVIQAAYEAIHDGFGYEKDVDIVKTWLESLPQTPQPDWSQAEDWAQWAAINADGWLRWHEREPHLASAAKAKWSSVRKSYDAEFVQIPLGIDWRVLKFRRPEMVDGDIWLEHMTAHAPEPEPEPPDDWPDEPDEDLPHYDTPGGY